MKWKNIRLIFRREMRDQLRDRRTLFMIAVLPILFYPLLGVSFFQIAQFLREHPSRVLILGYEGTVRFNSNCSRLRGWRLYGVESGPREPP